MMNARKEAVPRYFAVTALARSASGRGRVERFASDDDAVVRLRLLRRNIAVEHVAQHGLGIPFEWIAVAAAVRSGRHQPVASVCRAIGDFRRKSRFAARRGEQRQGGGRAVFTARESPRAIFVSLALDRKGAVGQKGEFADRAHAASPFAFGGRQITQLVSVDAKRQMQLDVFDRVVARVGVERVDSVHAVDALSSAVASFENFHLHPVATLVEAGEGDTAKIADAGAHLSGDALRERLHDGVSKRVAGTEARDDGRREIGIRQRSFRRDNVDRARQPHVLRHVSVHHAVEKDGSERQPDRAINRAFERHVDRPIVDLRRGAGQIDGHLVAAHLQRRLDLEIAAFRLRVVQETVDRRFGRVIAVRQRADRRAHQTLGIIHEILIGEHQGLEPILPHQREKPFGADLRGLDLRLHVAHDEVGRSDVVAQELPDRSVRAPFLDDLDRLELQAFRVGVDGADDACAAWS